MNTTEIKGFSVLLLGYSREGQSTHKWLTKHYPNISVTIADAQQVVPVEGTTPTIVSGAGYLDSLSAYDTVIRSPGISPYLPQLVAYTKAGGHMTSATSIFLSLARERTIGVTGTKGKSTTASLIAHILSGTFSDVRLVGNIGKPMLDFVDDMTTDTWFVAELSSHQLADVHISPHIAVLLGIVPEHLDYYPSLEAYIEAKTHITRFQSREDILICNPLSPHIAQVAHDTHAQTLLFGDKNDTSVVYTQDGSIVSRIAGGTEVVMHIADVPLLGNIENVMAAATAARALDIPAATIGAAIHPFKALPHRLEPIGEYRGITFYNDSLATIPQATMHALEALGSRVETLIAGGYDRHIDFTELGAYIATHPVKTLILFPDTGARIWEAIQGSKPTTTMEKIDVSSMKEAVNAAFTHTAPGKICLLSPASASYNMFRDYADRGEQFRACVTSSIK